MILHRYAAEGGETSLELPFVYRRGEDVLEVRVDDVIVPHTERTRSSVGLAVPLAAGAQVEVRAQLPSVWDRLPPHWRVEDEEADGILRDLFAAFDRELSVSLYDLRRMSTVRALDDTAPRFLAALAADLGWQLDASRLLTVTATDGQTVVPVPWLTDVALTRLGVLVNGEPAAFVPMPGLVTVQPPHAPLRAGDEVVVYDLLLRKIVGALVPLYRQKGTKPGILAAVRVFFGLEATVRALWADGWRLGRSALGSTTQLAPVVEWTTVGTAGQSSLALPFRADSTFDLLVEVDGVGRVVGGSLAPYPDFGVIALSPPLEGGERIEVTDARRALTLELSLPRTLSGAERALLLRVLDAWKPAKAVLWLHEPEAPSGTSWHLGYSRLGSAVDGAASWTYVAAGGESTITLPYVFALHQLDVRLNGTPLELGGAFDPAPHVLPPAGLLLATPLTAGDHLVVRWRGTTRLG